MTLPVFVLCSICQFIFDNKQAFSYEEWYFATFFCVVPFETLSAFTLLNRFAHYQTKNGNIISPTSVNWSDAKKLAKLNESKHWVNKKIVHFSFFFNSVFVNVVLNTVS